ncbi:hypothetical protein HPP92_026675 [Vanilla planifolia]|uniref:Uncharacterized protein n=1 Tax=Vanilla planifolia TaxID=51239 RepID=A0A835PDG5_VANPL|nr:hypothetical protein HPP92_026675 [Vanilla planifolia]
MGLALYHRKVLELMKQIILEVSLYNPIKTKHSWSKYGSIRFHILTPRSVRELSLQGAGESFIPFPIMMDISAIEILGEIMTGLAYDVFGSPSRLDPITRGQELDPMSGSEWETNLKSVCGTCRKEGGPPFVWDD